MRIRTVKPEFWRSDDITKLSREDRLLFIGLWSYVDDNGVGIDDYRAIAADLFALEDDQNEVRAYVRDGLATLSRGLLIDRYEADGKCLIHIRTWDDHQRVDRPNKARYPKPSPDRKPPTSGNTDDRDTLATPSREDRETPPSGTGEQGNRGTEVERPPSAEPQLPADTPADSGPAAKQTKRAPRKRPNVAIPDTWRPNDAHRSYAAEHGLNIDHEALKFRNHAEANDRRLANWDAGFRNWLASSVEYRKTRPLRAVSGGHQPYRNPPDESVYDEPMYPRKESK